MPKIIASEQSETEFRTRPVRGVSLFVSEGVIASVTAHAEMGCLENKEILGLLIGNVLRDDAGTYVKVTDTATSGLDADEISVRFRKDSIEELFISMDGCDGDAIVGWYHSHLGIGCYLSDVDIKTHVGIFGADVGYALVIDPVESKLASFSCSDGRPHAVPMIIMT
ncbi:MAG: hypothetical protein LBU30_05880 [Candidatus Methanoplasma sp.]|jgi:proteasome lid subunit RPN8/RPN11|nr:hypothetical protein [Candidatus Methanoplasma sp.]